MRFFSLSFLLLFKAFPAIFCSTHNMGYKSLQVTSRDTVPQPVFTSVKEIDSKVIMSSVDNNLEISPLSSFNNGLLIEPVNRVNNRGVPSAFYLKDSSSWSFYTDSRRRLTIDGKGEVAVTAELQVYGPATFDSTIFVRSLSDTNSFINFTRNVKYVTETDDGTSAYTTTPTAWSLGKNIPVFRIRHPLNVTGNSYLNSGIGRDFMILPYQFGTAIEYNGVVECWVGEWSIHKGLYYYDVENKNNGWGGVLWVGDDIDGGGIRATARNNTSIGGNVAYGELSVEQFGLGNVSNGDFRLRLPSTVNEFHFVYGERGSENIIAKMKNEGLVIPKISSVARASSPEKAQIVFDSTDNQFKGFNGKNWVNFESSGIKTGSAVISSNGTEIVYTISHGLTAIPSYFNVVATNENAANISFVTANNRQLLIHYVNPPVAGNSNLSWNWQVKK